MWQAFVALVQLLKLLDHLAWFLGRGALAGIVWTSLAVWRLALQCAGVDVDRKSRRGAHDRGPARGELRRRLRDDGGSRAHRPVVAR